MIPVDVNDILEGLAAARMLYEIGFLKANSPTPKYREFGQEIRNLAINLDILSNIVERARYDAGESLECAHAVDRGSHYSKIIPGASILNGFRETLRDCNRILGDQRYFQTSGGIVINVTWYHQIDPEVQRLKERVACHNIKASRIRFAFMKDRSFYLSDSIAALHQEAANLGKLIRGSEDGKASGKQLQGVVFIPHDLENAFIRLTQQPSLGLSIVTIDDGINAAVSYFHRLSKTENESNQSHTSYLTAIVDTMVASWLLRTVRASLEYDTAAKLPSTTAFERQMDSWGLTIDRFFDMFEEDLQESLRHLLGRDLLLPPTPELLQVVETAMPNLPAELESAPLPQRITEERTAEPLELGRELMNSKLKSSDPNYMQTLQVYSQTEKRCSLVLVKTPISEGREKETTDNYDLEQVQIIPSYALRTWTSPSLEPQIMLFKTDSAAPFSRTLTFQQNKDLFEFQQTITGYKVKHDDVRVLATSQESKLLGGSRRQDLCRLQIWAAPPLNVDPAAVTKAASPRSTSGMRRASATSFTSSSTGTNQSKRKASSPSLFSAGSRSSVSSRTSIAIDAPSLPGSAQGNNTKTGIYASPIAPCVVLFAHKAPTLSARVEGRDIFRSFLIIDITPEVTVEEELNENEHEDSSFRCALERKSSYLPARRSTETSDPTWWDLAAAGQHKRDKETEVVKKLKHVILEFNTRQHMAEFMTKFNQVKEIATWRLAKFVHATG